MEAKVQKGKFDVGDVVWHKEGYCYHRATVTGIDGETVLIGDEKAAMDNILPGSTFVVSDEVMGLTYAASIYEYLVFRTHKTDRFAEMATDAHVEGLYVEGSIGDGIVRQHFPGHPTGKADILRLLADLEEQT
ncbi:MAG: hypothetical protein ACLFVT_03780 [Syntrophobacteria bacterium]